MKEIQIGSFNIGPGLPVWIIAELSANHHQSLEKALELVHVAAQAGANAVKLQTYTPDTMTLNCPQDWFQIQSGTWKGYQLYQLYQEAYTPWEWHKTIIKEANDLGMVCFSSPFDASAVDFLESLNVPAYKIASFELVDLPLIRKIAQTGKAMIMSTGMGTLAEIEEAVKTAREAGCKELILLKCTSAYPAEPEQMNLVTLPHLAQAFGCFSGLSDHTLSPIVPALAVSQGACVIEKHLIFDRAEGGPDSQFSLEPDEFAEMVSAVRLAEKALGQVVYAQDPSEQKNKLFRRSVFITKDLSKGSILSPENIAVLRPSLGLHPRYFESVQGKKIKQDVVCGTPLSWDLLD
ncbi:MAG: pseudaminic acid synthase [Candidatus Sericytochromatia bacterium]